MTINTGEENSGDRNSGNWNSGDRNSGYGNSGYRNSGDRNSGYANSGDRNSGNWNSGNGNSGYRNSGDRNSGYANSGDWNSGNWNSGNGNSGYGNSTNRSSGIFNTEEATIICFNKDSSRKWDEINHPNFYEFYLTKWIPESDMTDEEKKTNPDYSTTGGYLKTFTYEEAWANYWRDTNEDDRQRVLNLPNFDAEVFKSITGINVAKKPATIEIGGTVYEVTDELKDALKNLKKV